MGDAVVEPSSSQGWGGLAAALGKKRVFNCAMGARHALGNPSQPLTARQQSTFSLVNHSGYHDYISLTFRSDIEGKTVLVQAA